MGVLRKGLWTTAQMSLESGPWPAWSLPLQYSYLRARGLDSAGRPPALRLWSQVVTFVGRRNRFIPVSAPAQDGGGGNLCPLGTPRLKTEARRGQESQHRDLEAGPAARV